MLKKVIIILISMFLQSSISFANPVPVFCLSGFLKNNPEWAEACKIEYNSISEYDCNYKLLKIYSIGNSISEYDCNYKLLKIYSIGNSISEYDCNYKLLKIYDINGNSISEYDCNYKLLKIYSAY